MLPTSLPMCDKIETKRLTYTHEGRIIYEWEQTLEEARRAQTASPSSAAARPACANAGFRRQPPAGTSALSVQTQPH